MSIKERIIEALKKVYDPEIPVNVYDLGLIYDLEVQGETVKVKMTLTAPGCPLAVYIPALVEDAIKTMVPEVKNVEVEIVWDPPWTPLRMTEEGRKRVKEIYGVDLVQEWLKRSDSSARA